MDRKVFIFLMILGMFFLAFVSAELDNYGTFKQGYPVNLVQTCLNSSYSNISKVVYPNSSFALNAQTSMTKNGDDYNYSFPTTSATGQYIVYGICDINNTKLTWSYGFFITPTGTTFDISKATMYFLVLIVSFVLFSLSLWAGISLPHKNKKDQFTGYVIAVSNVKYLKMFMIALSYLILMLIMYLSWIISYAFLDIDFLTTLFRFGFYFMAIACLPLFIVLLYVVIANWVRDSKVADMLQHGLRVGAREREN